MIIRREVFNRSNDLNVSYRPCKVDEMIGNETSKKIIKNALDSGKMPHTQLFTGGPGCGKTTAARIIALGLNCENSDIKSQPCLECNSCKSILSGSSLDVREINVGQTGGKDYISSLVNDLALAPFNSKFKILILDEAHELTTAAKDLLLKPIENGYDHVYFIFCTNQPEKLKSKKKGTGEAFLDRCSILNFDRISTVLMKELVQNVCEFEGFEYNQEVLDIIIDESTGVPRNALVWLNQIATEGTWTKKAAKEICGSFSDENDPQIIELCRALNKGNFKAAVSVFDSVTGFSVENMRIIASAYFVNCLKRSKKVYEARKYSKILDVMTIPIYEQGKLANHKFYNYLFKVSDIVSEEKAVKR